MFLVFLFRMVLFQIFRFLVCPFIIFLSDQNCPCSDVSLFSFVIFQICPFRNYPFSDLSFSKISFFRCFLFRIVRVRNVSFSESFVLQFSFFFVLIFLFRNCPFSTLTFSELSFFRIVRFLICPFRNCREYVGNYGTMRSVAPRQSLDGPIRMQRQVY